MTSETVVWPAVVYFPGDAELVPIADEPHWRARAAEFQTGEQLIDSTGKRYDIEPGGLVFSGETLALEAFLGLVKAHAASAGSCCVAKLHAPTIVDAMALVASLPDD